MSTRTPSKFQTAIYDFVRTGKGNATVEAVAGSGKTTTLEGICRILIDGDEEGLLTAIFCAFNKSIADELRSRLPQEVDVKTIHAIGMAALRQALRPYGNNWVNDYKYRDIISELLDQRGYKGDDKQEMAEALEKSVRYTMLTLIDPMNLGEFESMLGRFDIPHLDNLDVLTNRVLEIGESMARQKISFTDMIYLPIRLGVAFPKYLWVLVDEAQDLSNCQREIIRRLMGPASRLIAVGDPKQAIYGFAGADTLSFAQIQSEFQTTNLPLSVCYRCPKGHIAMAQEIVPQIEAHDAAPEGEIEWIGFDEIYNRVDSKRRDMVLCRTNAPLVEIAFSLIAQGVPAQIKGRDIMDQLINMAKAVQKLPGANWDEFEAYLSEFVSRQTKALQAKRDTEMQIMALQDRAECLNIIYRRAVAMDQRIKTLDGLRKFIDRLYSEDVHGSVMLSSIHKAKGLEADRVFLVGPEKMPHPMARSTWAIEQEFNLRYVALTRAKEALYFVPLKDNK